MGGMGEEEIVIMYHYIEDKVFLKDMKYLCSNIINQFVPWTHYSAEKRGAQRDFATLSKCFFERC